MSNAPTSPSELRRFLLGTASEADAEAFSLRLLEETLDESEEALSNALADEDDLFDEYARGELEPEVARKLEALLPSRPEARGRVEFARALALQATPSEEREVIAHDAVSTGGWRGFLPGLRPPAARLAWAAALLLLSATLVQTVRLGRLQSSLPIEPTTAESETNATVVAEGPGHEGVNEAAADMARLESEADELRRRLEQSTQQLSELRSRLERADTAAPQIARILLIAATRGAHLPVVATSARTRIVELQVDLTDVPTSGGLRARLLDANRFQVWGLPSVATTDESGNRELRLEVPSQVLVSGAYTLVLQVSADDGSWSDLVQHEFRIERRGSSD
ncbi:MAG: hypothetical protein MPN21_14065 [Thermoanaerobaculia bacterium]|nr:hypothetical protein [Thermoanaerobaculia bacterium]